MVRIDGQQLLQFGADQLLQPDGVCGKLADSVRELLHSHLVLVVLVAERGFIQTHLLQVHGLSYRERGERE